MDIAGLESLAGGHTGSHPYSGPDGEKRFAKMRENVIKEWKEEQRKKIEIAEKEAINAIDASTKEGKIERLKAKLFGPGR